jgi:excisionase family DNA binding protein
MSVDIEALAAELAPLLTPNIPPLLDSNQAAELLNVPASWLMAEARANRVPNVKLGKYRRFKRDDLLAWVDGRSVGPRGR